jgi:hypothetical protein
MHRTVLVAAMSLDIVESYSFVCSKLLMIKKPLKLSNSDRTDRVLNAYPVFQSNSSWVGCL